MRAPHRIRKTLEPLSANDGDGDDSATLSFADDLWCPDDCGISDDGKLPPDLEALLLRHHGG